MQSMATMASECGESNGLLTVSFSGDFRGRTQLVKVVRQTVVGMLAEAGCDREAQSIGMIAAQELTENVVKYSRTDRTSLTAAVRRLGACNAGVRLETSNDATADEVERLAALLAEIEQRPAADALYQERIASSSTRTRSELGLLRILTEAAMALDLRVEGDRVHLQARHDALNVTVATSARPKTAGTQAEGGGAK